MTPKAEPKTRTHRTVDDRVAELEAKTASLDDQAEGTAID